MPVKGILGLPLLKYKEIPIIIGVNLLPDNISQTIWVLDGYGLGQIGEEAFEAVEFTGIGSEAAKQIDHLRHDELSLL